jgi:hypothetical protein
VQRSLGGLSRQSQAGGAQLDSSRTRFVARHANGLVVRRRAGELAPSTMKGGKMTDYIALAQDARARVRKLLGWEEGAPHGGKRSCVAREYGASELCTKTGPMAD